MTSIALVGNRESGSGLDVDAVGRLLQSHGASVRAFDLGDVDEAASSGADRLAVAGGDGSIGPVAAAAGAAGLPLAVIPGGTANDFARTMGLPAEVAEACHLAAQGETLRGVELADMDGRPFVNVASAGLPARAAQRARGWKPRLGTLAYLAGALLAGLTERPVRCRVTCDGVELFDGRAWQVTVAASGAFGAGLGIEAADSGDGLLDVVVIEAGSRAGLARRAYGLRAGRVLSQRGVRHVRADEVAIEAPAETAFNVDGEVVRGAPALFRVAADAFSLVTP